MKILIATGLFPPDIGGPATYSKLLSDELPKGGVHVDVQSFGSVRHLPRVIRHAAFFFRVLWHARAADVIFAQDTVSVGLPSFLAAYLLGKIFVVRVPGDYAWEQSHRFGASDSMEAFQTKRYGFRIELIRKLQRFVVGCADQVIVPSKSFADVVRKWLKDPAKVAAIYNGVDLSVIASATVGITFRPKTIVSAGRLVPGKGFEMLIKALLKLPGWKLEIAGDGPGMTSLQQIIEHEGLLDRARLLGRVSREELAGIIAGAEVFALNTAFETFSFQIVEAMAAGTPVIATNVGSLPELIDSGINGVLIPPDDQQAFLAAISRISADKDFRDKMVFEAKKKSQAFSVEMTASAVQTVLDGLCTSDASVSVFLRRRQTLAKLVRYLFSGGAAAVTDLVLLYIFTDIANIWYVTSSVLAFLVAFLVSFVLQKFFTFQDHGTDGMKGQAAIYLGVTGANLAVNTGLIYLLVQFTGIHYIAAQVLTSIAIAIESYILYGMFIFKKS